MTVQMDETAGERTGLLKVPLQGAAELAAAGVVSVLPKDQRGPAFGRWSHAGQTDVLPTVSVMRRKPACGFPLPGTAMRANDLDFFDQRSVLRVGTSAERPLNPSPEWASGLPPSKVRIGEQQLSWLEHWPRRSCRRRNGRRNWLLLRWTWCQRRYRLPEWHCSSIRNARSQ